MDLKKFAEIVDDLEIDFWSGYASLSGIYAGNRFYLRQLHFPLYFWWSLEINGDYGTYGDIEKPMSNIIAYPLYNKLLLPSEDERYDAYCEELEKMSSRDKLVNHIEENFASDVGWFRTTEGFRIIK